MKPFKSTLTNFSSLSLSSLTSNVTFYYVLVLAACSFGLTVLNAPAVLVFFTSPLLRHLCNQWSPPFVFCHSMPFRYRGCLYVLTVRGSLICKAFWPLLSVNQVPWTCSTVFIFKVLLFRCPSALCSILVQFWLPGFAWHLVIA